MFLAELNLSLKEYPNSFIPNYMKRLILLLIAIPFIGVQAQTNIRSSNPVAENVLLGNYNPANYIPIANYIAPKAIVAGIDQLVNSDSLYRYMLKLESFKNRNTASDTVSSTIGIGAARRWVYQWFKDLGAARSGRVIPSYLEFNHSSICSQPNGLYKNIYCVLPGTDTADKSIIIVEGHIDSRCEDVCDLTCSAEGMEDNATGTALVMELARVMSTYNFKNTLVFLIVIGEEQGLYGADAFAKYCQQKNIQVKAVLNNDVIGGVICGKTSSPPSCPGLNDVDSTQVRLFSSGKIASPYKSLARYTKLQYQEELLPIVKVPMQVTIMNAEDRTNRGGDHIPFRQLGYAAIRFTSANEHGDANPVPNYTDRQHSTRDVLGVDRNSDGIVDSFFVDFHYLARNTVINGATAAMLAQGVKVPAYDVQVAGGKISVVFTDSSANYKIGVRTISNDFRAIYTASGARFDLPDIKADTTYYVSVARMDEHGVESLFGAEKTAKTTTGISAKQVDTGIELLDSYPNPFDESTTIAIQVNDLKKVKEAYLMITDIQGKLIQRIPVNLSMGMNEILYTHGYHVSGTYQYTLFLDGQAVGSKKMVFTN